MWYIGGLYYPVAARCSVRLKVSLQKSSYLRVVESDLSPVSKNYCIADVEEKEQMNFTKYIGATQSNKDYDSGTNAVRK